jgi:TATA-box binding protein (TBP) (component of TFIID and TFIIIB)
MKVETIGVQTDMGRKIDLRLVARKLEADYDPVMTPQRLVAKEGQYTIIVWSSGKLQVHGKSDEKAMYEVIMRCVKQIYRL